MLKIKDLKVGNILTDYNNNELEIVYIFNDYISLVFNGKELQTVYIDDLNATFCKLKQPEPERIQGFAVGNYYVPVCVRDNENKDWHLEILQTVENDTDFPFCCLESSWKYAKPLTDEDIVVPNYKL